MTFLCIVGFIVLFAIGTCILGIGLKLIEWVVIGLSRSFLAGLYYGIVILVIIALLVNL